MNNSYIFERWEHLARVYGDKFTSQLTYEELEDALDTLDNLMPATMLDSMDSIVEEIEDGYDDAEDNYEE